MKKTLLALFIAMSFIAFSQESISMEAIAESACTCLIDVAKKHNNKTDFEDRFSICLGAYINTAQEFDSTLNTPEKLRNLVSITLKENCSEFIFIDSVYQHYVSTPETDFIVSIADCQLLKTGNFITAGDKDSTIIEMREALQILKFKSGAYTKSEVVWLGPCSYKTIRIESTDPYEKAMVKPGEERVIRIINVKDKSEFTYELELGNGGVHTGKLIMLREDD